MQHLKLFSRSDRKPTRARQLRLTDQYWQRLGELAEAKQLDRAAYLEHYVDDLEQAKDELRYLVAGMQDMAVQDQEYIKDLTSELEQLEYDNTRLQQKIQQLNAEKAVLQQQIQQLNAKTTTLQQKIQQSDAEKAAQPVQQLDVEEATLQPPDPAKTEPQAGASRTPLLKKLVSVLLSLAILFLIGGFTLPSTVHVERSIHIDSTPVDIFPLVGDLGEWSKWSPWAEMDPDMEMTVTGLGKGQQLQWHSDNPRVGHGTQELTIFAPPTYVKSHLDFGNQGVADATFLLEAEEEGSRVSWALDTDMREGVPLFKQPISTYFQLFMDDVIGKDYELGLSNLKNVAEQESSQYKNFFEWAPLPLRRNADQEQSTQSLESYLQRVLNGQDDVAD
ncbi:MAG: SRPBCC family protein [Cyanobacteria bacterium P01_A01_bin.17]